MSATPTDDELDDRHPTPRTLAALLSEDAKLAFIRSGVAVDIHIAAECRAASFDCGMQDGNDRGMESLDLAGSERVCPTRRMDPSQMKRFVNIDIPQARDQPLPEQEWLGESRTALQNLLEVAGRKRAIQWFGTHVCPRQRSFGAGGLHDIHLAEFSRIIEPKL